jgi:protein required for attachment to host cells
VVLVAFLCFKFICNLLLVLGLRSTLEKVVPIFHSIPKGLYMSRIFQTIALLAFLFICQPVFAQSAVSDSERAQYWAAQGYNFNPSYMTASMMDRKVVDIERAKYWSNKGYNFDPSYMTASMMDRKVVDIERAKYWTNQGYNFDPSYMTASMMDRKVVDIERAKYWTNQGYNFDPSYMTASMMDRKVVDIERAKYWANRGYNFDPSYMTASMMDRQASQPQNTFQSSNSTSLTVNQPQTPIQRDGRSQVFNATSWV